MPRDIILRNVIGAHGLKGEVRVKTFTESPEALGAYGPLQDGQGRAFVVEQLRATGAGEAIARLAGVADRDAAEALRGTELRVPRSTMPAAGTGTFYHADLVGLRAEDEAGRLIGTVSGLHNFGAGDVIEILRDDGDNVFLPFSRDVVPVVEEDRIVIAEPPASGGDPDDDSEGGMR
jgi:16S rRNA processing protein RimM